MEQIKFSDSLVGKQIVSKDTKSRIKENLLQKSHIKQKLKELKASKEEFDELLGYFVSYDEDFEACKDCKSLKDCKKEIKGMKMDLVRDEDGDIVRVYDLCDLKKEERRINQNYLIRDFPDAHLNVELEDLDGRKGRINLEYELLHLDINNDNKKGIFVFGKPNTGKSFPFIAFLNGLVRKDVKCAFVNVREFTELLKRGFNDLTQNVNDTIDIVKDVTVLVLDDLGDEKISEWVRDDVLTTILDYRFKNGLVTFITSSYDLKELEILYTVSKTSKAVASMKAEKFIEKIKNSCPIIIEVK